MASILATEKRGGNTAAIAEVLSRALAGKGEYDLAERAVSEWLRIAPTNNEAVFFRAILLRLLGRDNEADKVSEQSAKQHKIRYAEEVWKEMLALVVEYQRSSDADRLLTRALTRVLAGSERAGLYALRGDLRRQTRTYEDGFDDLTAAVRLYPGYPEARKMRAELALQLKRYSDAFEDADMLTYLTPGDPAAHRLLTEVRSVIQLSVAIAGRTPDYRPAAPLITLPRSYQYGAILVETYLPNR